MDIILAGNTQTFLLLGGLGFPRYDELKSKYPNQVFNCEASEQTMLDLSCGLAYSGKIPFVYTITPFLLRGMETVRTYIDHENLSVVMIGVGQDDDYSKHDGFSHEAGDIVDFFRPLKNIEVRKPQTLEAMKTAIDAAIKHKSPYFINIKK